MRDFKQLAVWEKAHHLALAIYRVTASFPAHELYGLSSQMRRAALSIPSNIAEGCGRGSETELARFMQISMGSASELEYQLLMAHDLSYLEEPTYNDMLEKTVEVKRMLAPFINRLRRDR